MGQLAEKGWKWELTEQGRDCLGEYHWPGNIRQLIKVLKRAVYLNMEVAEAIEEERRLGSLEPEVGPVAPAAFLPKTVDEIRPLDEIRNAYARHALSLYRGNVHAAARALQVTDRTLLARLDKKPAERTPRVRKAR